MAVLQLLQRALEHPVARGLHRRAQDVQTIEVEIPTWGKVLLAVSFIGFIIFMSAVEYTLKDVIATLAMVETPSAAITVSPSIEDGSVDKKEGLLESGPTITLVRTKPITSSIRGTIRHLVSEAGRFSRWRGIKALFLYQISTSLVVNILNPIIPYAIPGRFVVLSAATGALLANLHATWTHKVISMPSDKSFWQRVVPRSQWKKLALPAAVESSAKYVSMYIAQGFIVLLGLGSIDKDDMTAYKTGDWVSLALRGLSVLAILLSCVLFIVLPAVVTLIRVEASILPEDQDTIVPFDRTFGGKVVPQILGGTGCVGFLDAWRSFNWEARRRLIKLYAKIAAIIFAISLVAVHVLAFEVWAVMGSALGKLLADAQRNGLLQ
ncbi:hypothetical protein K491DRAFT_688781 [Lophiostoma macrostomum CBS 122681]|uniref:Ubiquitin conjugating enzyme n=1 Tax=Lophiostoma macrostomum CBS 122681 TaxID=1314788 RepID=A0A6A6TJK5_9PLEO|nr:hypothetical protein K491DRAFT_688781 [Lophiostoma macrostomum CBS 122681]